MCSPTSFPLIGDELIQFKNKTKTNVWRMNSFTKLTIMRGDQNTTTKTKEKKERKADRQTERKKERTTKKKYERLLGNSQNKKTHKKTMSDKLETHIITYLRQAGNSWKCQD